MFLHVFAPFQQKGSIQETFYKDGVNLVIAVDKDTCEKGLVQILSHELFGTYGRGCVDAWHVYQVNLSSSILKLW